MLFLFFMERHYKLKQQATSNQIKMATTADQLKRAREYQKTKTRRLAYQKKYYEEHREEILAYRHKQYAETKKKNYQKNYKKNYSIYLLFSLHINYSILNFYENSVGGGIISSLLNNDGEVDK